MFRVLAALAFLALTSANIHDRAYYEERFFNWLKEHDVKAESGGHFVKMLQNFANNDDLIATHNAGNNTYTLAHNQFSHMSSDEWLEYVNRGALTRPVEEQPPTAVLEAAEPSTLASSIDWRSSGYVTGVKNQGNCGSCWSFSTTGALEHMYKARTGSLTSFSEQHLVSCDTTDSGCGGGWMSNAFTWTQKNGGICTESAYPYTSGSSGASGSCKSSSCSKVSGVAPNGYTNVAKGNDGALATALNGRTVSVAVDASKWQLYSSGVFSNCGTSLNHGVLAVGYSDSYWIIKNSWGTGWGEQGYIRLARGNTCGVLSGPPSYPNK